MKIKTKTGRVIDLPTGFVEWFSTKFSEKGFEVKNKYAFVRGFMRNWSDETIERWIEKFENEKKSFWAGLLDVKLPF
jgi:GMP synthase-like glutamine amidotransferase